MTKILLGLFMLSSLSVFANEYTTYKTTCEISSEEANISDPENKQHKNKITFEITAIGLNDSKKILRETLNSNELDLVKPLISGIKLGKVFCLDCDRDVVGKRHLGFKLNIERESAQKILENNSRESVPNLPKGIKETKIFPKMKSDWSWNNWIGEYEFRIKKRFQIHFEPSVLDGLSYHIMLTCTQKGKY
jgi:hypothetical protein